MAAILLLWIGGRADAGMVRICLVEPAMHGRPSPGFPSPRGA